MIRNIFFIVLISSIMFVGCSKQSAFESIFIDAVSHRELNEDDLKSLNREQLRVVRNGIYASYGRPFSSVELNYMFYIGELPIFGQNFEINQEYSDVLLTGTDRDNAKNILLIEKAKDLRFVQNDPRVAFFNATYEMSTVECFITEAVYAEPNCQTAILNS